jgi:hypothetical protein
MSVSSVRGCPSCLGEAPTLFVSDADLRTFFGDVDPTANVLACPRCEARWILERSVGSGTMWMSREAPIPRVFQGVWSFYECAPRGDGDARRFRLALTRDGDALEGEFEEHTWNDYAYEETLKVQKGRVRGRVEGDLAVLTIEGFAICVSASRRSEQFAIAPVARHDFSQRPVLELFVADDPERLRRHAPHRSWKREEA